MIYQVQVSLKDYYQSMMKFEVINLFNYGIEKFEVQHNITIVRKK